MQEPELNALRPLSRLPRRSGLLPVCLALLAIAPDARAADAPAVAATPAARAAEPRFDILAYLVSGDTLLGAAAIERIVYPFLGPQRTAADAEGARKALEQAYQAAGYLSVSVVLPPQRIDAADGELRLEVMQGAVDRLRVTGAQHTRPQRLREALPSVAPGSVPNLPELQEELTRLAQAGGDREVTPLISAGERPGSMAVELKVQDRLPLQAGIELNNRQSPNTQAGRVAIDLGADDLFQRGHALSLNWLVSPRATAEANIVSLSYQLPVPALAGSDGRLMLGWTHSNSSAVTAISGNNISRGDTLRLRWREALPTRPGLSQALSWGLTVYALQDRRVDGGGAVTTPPSLRYPAFNAAYELALLPAAGAPPRSSQLQLQFTAGLPGLGGRTVDCDGTGTLRDQFDCKRSGARPGFQVLGLTLQHREPLGRGYLNLRLQGQYSDAPLVSGEQAVYGGVDSVRGYLDGDIAGDLGAALRIELGAPAWQPWPAWRVQALGFLDAAQAHRHNALPGEVVNAHLASTGLGLQLDAPLGLQATLSWARLLVDRDTRHGQRWDLALRQRF